MKWLVRNMKNYQFSPKGKEKTRWRKRPPPELPPPAPEKEGTKGIYINFWKKSICLGLESLEPLERPKGIVGWPGMGRASPLIVTGVDISTSQNPPSIAHLNLFIFQTVFVCFVCMVYMLCVYVYVSEEKKKHF